MMIYNTLIELVINCYKLRFITPVNRSNIIYNNNCYKCYKCFFQSYSVCVKTVYNFITEPVQQSKICYKSRFITKFIIITQKLRSKTKFLSEVNIFFIRLETLSMMFIINWSGYFLEKNTEVEI